MTRSPTATGILSPSIRSHGPERQVQKPNLHTQHTPLYGTAILALYCGGVEERCVDSGVWGREGGGEKSVVMEYIFFTFTIPNALQDNK